ncbi:hypothetical protein D3C84_455410 [compost metagenome]
MPPQASNRNGAEIKTNSQSEGAGFVSRFLQSIDGEIEAATESASEPGRLGHRFLFVGGERCPVARERLDAVANESHPTPFKVGRYYPFHFSPKYVQRAHYILCVVVDVIGYVSREAVDIRV